MRMTKIKDISIKYYNDFYNDFYNDDISVKTCMTCSHIYFEINRGRIERKTAMSFVVFYSV